MKFLRILACIIPISLLLFCADILKIEGDESIPPEPVTLFDPADSDVYASSIFLKWTRAVSEHFAAYKLFYDTDSAVSDSSIYVATIVNINDTTFQLTGLDTSTTYFIKVYVYSASYSASNVISVTTSECNCGQFTGIKENSMILVPAGCFIDKNGAAAEISYDFFIDTTEITTEMWDYYINDTINTSKLPKNKVSFYDAVYFCNKRSKKWGKDTCYTYTFIQWDTVKVYITDMGNLECDFSKNGFRIPTEDEWEYCYRASVTTDFYWGKQGNYSDTYPYDGDYPKTYDDTVEINSYVWWFDHIDPQEVALKKPNNWHLYDMAGNVSERVWDFYYKNRTTENRINYKGPTENINIIDPLRVIRGGNYYSNTYMITANYRSELRANIPLRSNGFRCVRLRD